MENFGRQQPEQDQTCTARLKQQNKWKRLAYKACKLQVITASLSDKPAYLAATPTRLIPKIYILPLL